MEKFRPERPEILKIVLMFILGPSFETKTKAGKRNETKPVSFLKNTKTEITLSQTFKGCLPVFSQQFQGLSNNFHQLFLPETSPTLQKDPITEPCAFEI